MPDLRRSTIAAGLTLALAVGLAACGADNDDAPTADTAPPASASPSVSQVVDASATPSPASSAASPSESASPSGPYEPATSKHPARNVPDPGPLPKVAKEKSKAGQVAFIEHWFKELNYGRETNELRPEFWEMTSESCSYCLRLHKSFKVMQKKKSWVTGGNIIAKNIQPNIKPLDDGIYEVDLSVIEEPLERFVAGNAETVEQDSGGTVEHTFAELRRVNGQWRLEGIYPSAN